MSYVLKDIGHALQKERDRQGLTQRSLATKAGTTQARVSNIENGETDLRLSTLIEFARALDLEFVLVPRQKVPAVQAIIAQQAFTAEEKARRTALNRMSNLIIQLQERHPNNDDLTSLLQTTRELTNFRLSDEAMIPIHKIIKALKLVNTTPDLANTLDSHAAELRHLRNDIAHGKAETVSEPQPAYSLEDEDDG